MKTVKHFISKNRTLKQDFKNILQTHILHKIQLKLDSMYANLFFLFLKKLI